MSRRSAGKIPVSPTSNEQVDRTLKPLSLWFVVLAVASAAVFAVPLTLWLLAIAGDDPARQIDAIRTGLTTAAGTGGLFALGLAFHRQRSTERIAETTRLASKRDHEERVRVAEITESDSLARRIIDQYAKSADQLGSDKAPVRLAGLYALDKIGEENASERQAVMNLICAYLRMPFDPYGYVNDDERRIISEELEVRRTAQRRITERTAYYVNPEDGSPPGEFWPDVAIDLSGASLVDMSFARLRVSSLMLRNASLSGKYTSFFKFKTERGANFMGSTFNGPVDFSYARFMHVVNFVDVKFMANTIFRGTQFRGMARLDRCHFASSFEFDVKTQHQFVSDGDLTNWPAGSRLIPDETDKKTVRIVVD